jgi:hypothetical protein
MGMHKPSSCYFLVGTFAALSLVCSMLPMALETMPVQNMTVWHSRHLFPPSGQRIVELRAPAALLSSGEADAVLQSSVLTELRVPPSLLMHIQSSEMSDMPPTAAPESYIPARYQHEQLRVVGGECR